MEVAYCLLQSQGHNYRVTGNVVVCSHGHMPSPHAVAAISAVCIRVGYMYAGVTQTQRGWQDLVRPHTSSACTELPSARLTQRCIMVAVSETTCMSNRTQLLTSLCLLMLTTWWLCVWHSMRVMWSQYEVMYSQCGVTWPQYTERIAGDCSCVGWIPQ